MKSRELALAYSRMTNRIYVVPKRVNKDGSVSWKVDVTDQFWEIVRQASPEIR